VAPAFAIRVVADSVDFRSTDNSTLLTCTQHRVAIVSDCEDTANGQVVQGAAGGQVYLCDNVSNFEPHGCRNCMHGTMRPHVNAVQECDGECGEESGRAGGPRPHTSTSKCANVVLRPNSEAKTVVRVYP
jgi:hypothetical protein